MVGQIQGWGCSGKVAGGIVRITPRVRTSFTINRKDITPGKFCVSLNFTVPEANILKGKKSLGREYF